MKRILSMCLTLCILVSMFISFDITASAKTTMKKTTVTVSNSAKAINVSWKKVSGAKSYKVYRKVAGAKKYSVVKSTNSKTVKYADKKVTAGKTYYYRVVAINGKNKTTSATKSIVRLLAPTNLNAKCYVKYNDTTIYDENSLNVENITGVKLTWKKSKGANKYDIYRRVNNGKYKKIKTTGNVSSYVDEKIVFEGVATCYYKVVAKKNKSTSVSSSVKKIVYVLEPGLAGFPISDGVELSGFENRKCDGYKLYRSTDGKKGTYSLIAKLKKDVSTYVDKDVTLNKTYWYKAVAYKGSSYSCEMFIRVKYQPEMTINVKVGEKDDAFKVELEKEIAGIGNNLYTMDIFSAISLDPEIATISDDFVITGVSAGTTKVKIIVDYGLARFENGFILVNVE